MNGVIELGLAKETEKAVLVSYSDGGYWLTTWLPRSQIEILAEGEKWSQIHDYHSMKADCYGRIQDGKVRITHLRKSIKVSIPAWLFKQKFKKTTLGLLY